MCFSYIQHSLINSIIDIVYKLLPSSNPLLFRGPIYIVYGTDTATVPPLITSDRHSCLRIVPCRSSPRLYTDTSCYRWDYPLLTQLHFRIHVRPSLQLRALLGSSIQRSVEHHIKLHKFFGADSDVNVTTSSTRWERTFISLKSLFYTLSTTLLVALLFPLLLVLW